MGYLVADLLASVRLRTNAPSATAAFPDADILILANEELQNRIVPLIMKHREEHLTGNKPSDYTIVSGTAGYRMHWRALNQKVREAKIVLAGGGERDLALINPAQAHIYATSGAPTAFYLEANKIILVPTPDAGGDTLRVRYFKRPSVITSGLVTLTVAPLDGTACTTSAAHGFTTSSYVDIILRRPGFDILAQDVRVTSVPTATTFTISASDVPADMVVGDYVALVDTAPFAQIPEGLLPLLYQATAVQVLAIMGDKANLSIAEGILENMEKNSEVVLAGRVEGEPKRVTSPNGLLGPFWRGNGGW